MSAIDPYELERISYERLAKAEAAVLRQKALLTEKKGAVDIMVAECILEVMIALLNDLRNRHEMVVASDNRCDISRHRCAVH